jgi:hypothetical protein
MTKADAPEPTFNEVFDDPVRRAAGEAAAAAAARPKRNSQRELAAYESDKIKASADEKTHETGRQVAAYMVVYFAGDGHARGDQYRRAAGEIVNKHRKRRGKRSATDKSRGPTGSETQREVQNETATASSAAQSAPTQETTPRAPAWPIEPDPQVVPPPNQPIVSVGKFTDESLAKIVSTNYGFGVFQQTAPLRAFFRAIDNSASFDTLRELASVALTCEKSVACLPKLPPEGLRMFNAVVGSI